MTAELVLRPKLLDALIAKPAPPMPLRTGAPMAYMNEGGEIGGGFSTADLASYEDELVWDEATQRMVSRAELARRRKQRETAAPLTDSAKPQVVNRFTEGRANPLITKAFSEIEPIAKAVDTSRKISQTYTATGTGVAKTDPIGADIATELLVPQSPAEFALLGGLAAGAGIKAGAVGGVKAGVKAAGRQALNDLLMLPQTGVVPPGAVTPPVSQPVRLGDSMIARTPTQADPISLVRGEGLFEDLQSSVKAAQKGVTSTTEQMTVADMRKALDAAGLDSSGTQSVVANRFRDFKAAQEGVTTPSQNVSNVARQTYNNALEQSADPEAARLAARKAAAQESASNARVAEMEKLLDSMKAENYHAGLPVTDIKFGTWKEEASSLLGLPRTIKASFDLSAPGRQGLALAFRHPQEWAQSWVPMLRAWKDPSSMRAINDTLNTTMGKWTTRLGDAATGQTRLLDAPLQVMDENPFLHLYKVGPDAPGIERATGFEAAGKGFVGDLVRKVPGLENSERAYATFINSQKVKTFDNMAEALWRSGERNPEAYRNLGQVIDHATGYGAAPFKDPFLGQALFSQRYTTSRMQFLIDPIYQALVKRDMNAARAATENLVAFMGGMAGLLMLGKESGVWDVDFDPRSSDFGKVRVGPQRFDFGAGFLPLIRTATRMATGEGKAITGEVYDVDPKKELLKFFRNKLAPVPGQAVTQYVGEDPIRQPAPGLLSIEMLRDLFMPLLADAALETFKETGDPLKTGLTIASELVGGGTSAYGSGQVAQKEVARARFGQDYDSLHSAAQAEINAEIAESGTPFEWQDRQGVWWTARDDAFAYWQTQLTEEDRIDPIIQHILEDGEIAGLFPSMDSDGRLAKWIAQTYQLSRADAVATANKVSRETNLDDFTKAYRKGVAEIDRGIYEAWLEAYNKGEADDAPPKWLREFLESLGAEESVNAR